MSDVNSQVSAISTSLAETPQIRESEKSNILSSDRVEFYINLDIRDRTFYYYYQQIILGIYERVSAIARIRHFLSEYRSVNIMLLP